MRYGVGVDISKGKSTVTIMSETKEVIEKTFEITHDKEGLKFLEEKIEKYPKSKIKIVMEATGVYHLPVAVYFKERGYVVVIENAYGVKKYLDRGIRKIKTDKIDSKKLAKYCIENWENLREMIVSSKIYEDLRILSRQHSSQISIQVKQKVDFSNMCDMIFPGYYQILTRTSFVMGLEIFKEYNDPEEIKKISEEEFQRKVGEIIESMHKKRGAGKAIAHKIYVLAHKTYAPQKLNSSSKIVLINSIENLINTIKTTDLIITEMEKIARELPEFEEIMKIKGIGANLAARFIAEIGDIKRFENVRNIIAYAGLDAPPYQSGQYDLKSRHISKRGNKYLRRVGYEIVKSFKQQKSEKSRVYEYMMMKEKEGKKKKVVMIAGITKFIKIYYGTMKRIYKEEELKEVA